MKIKIIKQENIYKEYKDSTTTIYNYLNQVEQDGTLNKEELVNARSLMNSIFNMRKVKAIDENFIEMIKTNGIDNTANLANQMGADIGGFEFDGLKAVAINVEMGVNLNFTNPKSEDVEKYLKIAELFHLGLEDNKQYKKVLKSLNSNVENDLDNTPKAKPKNI